MKSRLSILMIFAVTLSYCGTESAKNSLEQTASGQSLPGPSNATSLGLEARLDGRYAQSIRIKESAFAATQPGDKIDLTFAASGMTNVKQFEVRVEIDPAGALTFEESSFAPTEPFVALPGHSIELMDGGQWRTGGASFGETKEGDDALGTLSLIASDQFIAGTRVEVRIAFFSLGPSFSDRDDYGATDLNMGLVINGN